MSHEKQDKGLNLSVSAPGKIILHGEHSVVYGKLAIAGSLGLRTHVNLIETNSDVCTFNYKTLNFEKSFDMKKIQKYLLDFNLPSTEDTACTYKTPYLIKHDHLILRIEEFLATSQETSHIIQNQTLTAAFYLLAALLNGLAIKPFNLTIDTELTVGAGCGSSASYSVCLAAIFLLYTYMKTETGDSKTKLEFTLEEVDLISDWAYCAEKIMHGTPSGIDNTICAYGSLVTFRKGGEKNIIQTQKNLSILLINTKISRNTKTLVESVRLLYDNHPEILNFVLNAMDKISETAISYIRMLDEEVTDTLYENLGNLMQLNQGLLKTLNVSHVTLDKICSILSENGLYGKLTGAGGGGYAIALVSPFFDTGVLHEVIEKLTEADFDVVLTDLGGPGVTIN